MDALSAGLEKFKEAHHGHKAEEKAAIANDPNVKPSERLDAAFEAEKHKQKEVEHACKADCKADDHKHDHKRDPNDHKHNHTQDH
ncbi:unnamed protein product [Didymodactylos carnosus]|uniref:Uncharacterized protein n=1 Tax=Didymodactylos carnosus TaxID=1234261 RepID=A0A815UIU0_9BILA|nr:unnamed protein product [Didymodactylos carnosus]CAF1616458.1 unnamed protein product [Didymodactylos carnosus]CAF4380646.1 unnamed protein product [Didymodactylos carnosus]CAF4433266.1 unnamed protein product [Didymodactylos carnosus]